MDLLQKVKSKSLEETLKYPSDIKELYKQMNEDICSYCPGIIKEKYLSLFKQKDEIIMSQIEKRLRMKPSKLIDRTMASSYPQGQYTDKNITDKISVMLIDLGYGDRFINPEIVEEVRAGLNKEQKQLSIPDVPFQEETVNVVFKSAQNEIKPSKSKRKNRL